jgi:indolepyruvate ferredoxin oxidoreductase alpha subunit
MSRQILLGDEAVALGAVHAGLSAAYSYPGTPASEILEYLVRPSGR